MTISVSPSITDIEVLIERGPSLSTETLHRSILPGLCLIFCGGYNLSMKTSSMDSYKLGAPMAAKVAWKQLSKVVECITKGYSKFDGITAAVSGVSI